jgi:hypothetical protein
VEESDPLALRAYPGTFIDQANARRAAPIERGVEIIDGKADVVDAGSALCDKPPDGRVVRASLQQFHERASAVEPGDSSTIGIIERNLGHGEHVAVERQDLVEHAHRNANVGDAGAAASGRIHRAALLSFWRA